MISPNGVTSASAGVVFGLHEYTQVDGQFQAAGFSWSVRRATAAVWLCFVTGQRSVGEAGYQLYVIPSALRICQGKRDVSLVCLCKENQGLMTHKTAELLACMHVHIPGQVYHCVHNLHFLPMAPACYTDPFIPLCTYCSLWGLHSSGPFPCGLVCQLSRTYIYLHFIIAFSCLLAAPHV